MRATPSRTFQRTPRSLRTLEPPLPHARPPRGTTSTGNPAVSFSGFHRWVFVTAVYSCRADVPVEQVHRGQPALAHGQPRQLRAVLHGVAVEQAVEHALHGLHLEGEPLGDLVVRRPLDHELQELLLAPRGPLRGVFALWRTSMEISDRPAAADRSRGSCRPARRSWTGTPGTRPHRPCVVGLEGVAADDHERAVSQWRSSRSRPVSTPSSMMSHRTTSGGPFASSRSRRHT